MQNGMNQFLLSGKVMTMIAAADENQSKTQHPTTATTQHYLLTL
jgi:hypothetical protein